MSSAGRADIIISRSRFDALVFDLDGVVTRTARVHAKAWKRMFDEYLERTSGGDGFEPFSVETDYRPYVDGKPRYDGVKSFLESRGMDIPYGDPSDPHDKETICGLGNRKNEIFLTVLKEEGAEVFQSSVDLIRNLRSRGFRIAVATSSKNCDAVLDSANIVDLFDAKVDGIDLESLDLPGKPAPDMFLEAARRLDADPKRTVTFEDAIAGVQACRSGGFGLVIGVNRADQASALKEAGADVVVHDLSEIDVGVGIKDLRNALASFEEVEEQVKGNQVVVFLDYDGTLTPIVSRPEDAVLSDEMHKILEELKTQCPVAVISGRGLADVRERVGIADLYYAGSHGFEISGPGGLEKELEQAARFLPVLDKAEREVGDRLAGIEGAQVEHKKFSIATHYRNVKEDQVASVKRIEEEVASGFPELRRSEGKKVEELQPDIDWDKGRAIEWFMKTLNLSRPNFVPFYIGDDITDEDAFEALKTTGITIVVGKGSRSTRAQYCLKDTDEVGEFLAELCATLEGESAWWLVHDEFIPEQEGLREALCTLGNGYFATRGAAPESKADDVRYPGTYLAGGYNRLDTVIAGRTIENEYLVNMPNWLRLEFRALGGDWLDV